jgi:hypothetical protein
MSDRDGLSGARPWIILEDLKTMFSKDAVARASKAFQDALDKNMVHVPPTDRTPRKDLVENPELVGTFYDAALMYIHTGDTVQDAVNRMTRAREGCCIPQTWAIGGES